METTEEDSEILIARMEIVADAVTLPIMVRYTEKEYQHLMEDIQQTDIELAFSTHCARYRTPRFLLTDNGSSNDILNNHQQSIVEVLQKNISMKILADSHQFLNIVQSTIKVFKNIARSIYHGVPAEAPLNTRAELQMIYSHVCNILIPAPYQVRENINLCSIATNLQSPF